MLCKVPSTRQIGVIEPFHSGLPTVFFVFVVANLIFSSCNVWFIAGTSRTILRTHNSLNTASDYRRGFHLPYLENKFAGTAVLSITMLFYPFCTEGTVGMPCIYTLSLQKRSYSKWYNLSHVSTGDGWLWPTYRWRGHIVFLELFILFTEGCSPNLILSAEQLLDSSEVEWHISCRGHNSLPKHTLQCIIYVK